MARDHYKDGFRDGSHGADKNPPHTPGFEAFKPDSVAEENRDYDRGYAAGRSASKNK